MKHAGDKNDNNKNDLDDDCKGDQWLMLPSLTKQKKGTILMLHGWAQNAKVIKFKTKNLTKYVYTNVRYNLRRTHIWA